MGILSSKLFPLFSEKHVCSRISIERILILLIPFLDFGDIIDCGKVSKQWNMTFASLSSYDFQRKAITQLFRRCMITEWKQFSCSCLKPSTSFHGLMFSTILKLCFGLNLNIRSAMFSHCMEISGKYTRLCNSSDAESSITKLNPVLVASSTVYISKKITDGDDDFLHLLVLGNTVTQQQLAETESDILAMLQYEVPLYSILHFQPVSEYFESSARKEFYHFAVLAFHLSLDCSLQVDESYRSNSPRNPNTANSETEGSECVEYFLYVSAAIAAIAAALAAMDPSVERNKSSCKFRDSAYCCRVVNAIWTESEPKSLRLLFVHLVIAIQYLVCVTFPEEFAVGSFMHDWNHYTGTDCNSLETLLDEESMNIVRNVITSIFPIADMKPVLVMLMNSNIETTVERMMKS